VITIIVLTAAAFLGGALNALAGGGSLVTFPALLFAGLNPIDANATSVVALFPGTFSSVWAYRRSILGITEVSVTGFFVLSLFGGLLGALLLLSTPSSVFAGLVPWLVLFATIVFAVGNFAPLGAIQRFKLGPRGALAVHFIISVYGGYFGGGIGFMMMAALAMTGIAVRSAGALKNILAGMANASAVLIFVFSKDVYWQQALVTAAGASFGGWAGALMLKSVNEKLLKLGVVAIGVALTIGLFSRAA
jgi:hypothetical protein